MGAGRDPEVGELLKIQKDWIPARASARFIQSKGRNDEICGFLDFLNLTLHHISKPGALINCPLGVELASLKRATNDMSNDTGGGEWCEKLAQRLLA